MSAFAEYKSLSCSSKGTVILYINGMANQEIDKVIPNTTRIVELLKEKHKNFDSKGNLIIT